MFVHLVGEPASGKTTFAHILEKLAGEENTKSSRLNKLSIDTEIARIIDAQLVICPDEDKQVSNHGNLKAMTGRGRISYREIYKQGADAYFFGTLVVVSNYPIFLGDTLGLERRTCLVHFANSVPVHKQNPNLRNEIEKELSALTSIALAMDEASVTDAIKGIGSAQIPAFRVHEWEMKCQSDTLAAFIDECVIQSPSDMVHVNDLFKAYLQHANDSNAKGTYKLQNFSGKFLEFVKWLGWNCSKFRNQYGMKIRGIRLRIDGDGDAPYASDTLIPPSDVSRKPHVDPCRPDVDPDVDLKLAQGAENVDYVDLKPVYREIHQMSLGDPTPSSPASDATTEKNANMENVGFEPTWSTQSSPGKVSESTSGSTSGLHGSTWVTKDESSSQLDATDTEPANAVVSNPPALQTEPPASSEPIKVGDIVIWTDAPGDLGRWNPFTVRSVEGNFAMLDYVAPPVPLDELKRMSS